MKKSWVETDDVDIFLLLFFVARPAEGKKKKAAMIPLANPSSVAKVAAPAIGAVDVPRRSALLGAATAAAAVLSVR